MRETFTIAAIEDILARGRLADWEPLISAIEAGPFGEVAEKTRLLCDRDLYAPPCSGASSPPRAARRRSAPHPSIAIKPASPPAAAVFTDSVISRVNRRK